MSDDLNEFRVTDIRWVNDIPVPEGYDFLPVDSMPEPKITFEAKLGPIDLGGDSGIIAKVEGNPPVVTPIGEFNKDWFMRGGLITPEGVIYARVSAPEPETNPLPWLKPMSPEIREELLRRGYSEEETDQSWVMLKEIDLFVNRLYFWTSSRGDHWEKIEADSAETAAIIQAERWNQKGYRGPFTIMVSVSGLEQPPKSGDKVTTFDLVPEVIFRAHKLEFKKLD